MKPKNNMQTRPTTSLLTGATNRLQPGASRKPHLVDDDATGIVTPSAYLEEHDTRFFVSSLTTVNNTAKGFQICIFSEIPYAITTTNIVLADFCVLSPKKLKFIKHVSP